MRILTKVQIDKNLYEGSDIPVFWEFLCPNCKEHLKLDLFSNKYFLLENLVESNDLSKDSIIKNGMAALSPKCYAHLGLFIVHPNLAAYYKLFYCNKCQSRFIIVYGFGESQPSRNILYVSGVWSYVKTSAAAGVFD